MKKRMGLIVFVVLILVTLSCNAPGSTPSGDEAKTVVAQTVSAQLTQSANGVLTPVEPGGPSRTPVTTATAEPTATQVTPSTATIIPSNTPTVTQTAIPCNWAQFVADITFPDDTEVNVNTGFVKTWRLKNVGSCTWNSSYQLVFSSGDQMGAPNSVTLTSGSVPPGGTVDISVNLTAPGSAGTYKGNFKLKAPDGAIFGIGAGAGGAFYVQIKAVAPAAPPPVEPPQLLLPDLIITDITLIPANPKKNQVTHVKVTAYNDGPGIASQFTVKWWGLSTFSSPSCSWDVMDTYPANGGRVLECDFTYISIYPPNLQTKAVIDTSNHVQENDEGNNTYLKTIPAVTD